MSNASRGKMECQNEIWFRFVLHMVILVFASSLSVNWVHRKVALKDTGQVSVSLNWFIHSTCPVPRSFWVVDGNRKGFVHVQKLSKNMSALWESYQLGFLTLRWFSNQGNGQLHIASIHSHHDQVENLAPGKLWNNLKLNHFNKVANEQQSFR